MQRHVTITVVVRIEKRKLLISIGLAIGVIELENDELGVFIIADRFSVSAEYLA